MTIALQEKFRDLKGTLKHEGFKGLVRRYGWKTVIGFFLIYLVRDLILYVLLPWLAISELI